MDLQESRAVIKMGQCSTNKLDTNSNVFVKVQLNQETRLLCPDVIR